MSDVQHWESLTRRSPLSTLAQRNLTAPGVVCLGCLGMGVATSLSVALTGDLGTFFGLMFVLVSATCALAADIRGLFAPGVLPPVLLAAVMLLVAITLPEAISVHGLAASAGSLQTMIAGVVDHATALVVGHLLALGIVGLRIAASPRQLTS